MTAWTKGLWTPSKGLVRKPDDPYPFKSIFVEVEAQALPMEVARVYGRTEKEINANAELVAAAAYPRDPMEINGPLLAVQNWEIPPMSYDIPDEPAEVFREMRDALMVAREALFTAGVLIDSTTARNPNHAAIESIDAVLAKAAGIPVHEVKP